MINVFDEIQKFIFRWEGGLTEDKEDAGGITNYGICLRFLRSVNPKATRDDIINMTKEKAKQLFYDNFWIPCKCDKLKPLTACVLYDSAVNCGVTQASKWLQRCIGCTDDGKIGNNTLKVANEKDDKEVALNMIENRDKFYNNLATNKPSQKVFLRGWLNRTKDLKKFILNLEPQLKG